MVAESQRSERLASVLTGPAETALTRMLPGSELPGEGGDSSRVESGLGDPHHVVIRNGSLAPGGRSSVRIEPPPAACINGSAGHAHRPRRVQSSPGAAARRTFARRVVDEPALEILGGGEGDRVATSRSSCSAEVSPSSEKTQAMSRPVQTSQGVTSELERPADSLAHAFDPFALVGERERSRPQPRAASDRPGDRARLATPSTSPRFPRIHPATLLAFG